MILLVFEREREVCHVICWGCKMCQVSRDEKRIVEKLRLYSIWKRLDVCVCLLSSRRNWFSLIEMLERLFIIIFLFLFFLARAFPSFLLMLLSAIIYLYILPVYARSWTWSVYIYIGTLTAFSSRLRKETDCWPAKGLSRYIQIRYTLYTDLPRVLYFREDSNKCREKARI